MSARFADLPIEVAVTHLVSSDGKRAEAHRPDAVRSLAYRVHAWRSAPETCGACLSMQAVALVAGMGLCARCREQRADRIGGVLPWRGRTVSQSRAAADDPGALHGHAIVFDRKSLDLGGFQEIIRPEAVDRLLSEGTDLRALWNHDSSLTLARTKAGTLSYQKDARGLLVDISPPRWAASHVESIERQDISGMSFAFRAIDDLWHLEDEMAIREVFDMHVTEISPVSFPAYPQTDINVGGKSKRSATDGMSISLLKQWHKTQLAR